MPARLADLPLALLAATVIGLGVTAAVLALLSVRRWVLPRLAVTEGDGEFAGAMVQAILVFYALAVALVAVGSWDRHSSLDDQVSSEAATLATLHREAQLYPEPVRTTVSAEVEAYLEYVIDEAWPAQRRGEVPRGGTEHMDAIQTALGRFEPASLGQQSVHEQALATFDRAVELRRLRLEAVEGHLSIAMWVFVLGGGGLAIAASFFFKVEDWRLHAVMVGLLATFIAMVVVLITAFDQPFVGDLAITPDTFRQVLASYGK